MAEDLGGYQTGAAYPSQFKAAVTPGYIAGALAFQGWRAPDLSRPFRHLDLGCGDGLCAAVVAASHPHASVEGVDGMTAHVEAGRAFAGLPGNLTLTAATFADVTEGAADCDFVTAQGVVAWVSAEVRAQVFDIAARRLRPGGVFAVSYNAMPGWASRLALQRLIREIAATAPGDPVQRFDRALGEVEALAEAKAAPVRPEDVKALIKQKKRLHPAYFVHEYLNEHGRPLWSTEVRAEMAARGLAYAGQAGFSRLRPELVLKAAQRAVVAKAGAERADALIDLLHDTPFRIDLYQRGPERLDDPGETWLLAERDADAALEHVGPAGRLRYDNPAAREALERLQDGPARLRDLAAASVFGEADVARAVDCLLIGRHVRPCAPPVAETAAIASMNRAIAAAAETRPPPVHALAGRCGPVAASAEHMRALADGAPPRSLVRRLTHATDASSLV